MMRRTPALRIELPNGLVKEITHSDVGRVYTAGGKIIVPGRSAMHSYDGPWTIHTERPIQVRSLSNQRVCLELVTWTCGDYRFGPALIYKIGVVRPIQGENVIRRMAPDGTIEAISNSDFLGNLLT